ncbi:hypothetical protein [Sphingopyxis sp.]|uniref:hypothetical protein n=1 Tax=Sphingopyxis sp. TaxID=1908224 RepID=UPI001D5C7AE7|nr:hypothetical protein [Sphingopyxis sp.]MBW8295751.1 hypothetical protein [Sphingopyxis sp.]
MVARPSRLLDRFADRSIMIAATAFMTAMLALLTASWAVTDASRHWPIVLAAGSHWFSAARRVSGLRLLTRLKDGRRPKVGIDAVTVWKEDLTARAGQHSNLNF